MALHGMYSECKKISFNTMKNEIRIEFDIIKNDFKQNHPFCQYCGKPTEHIHHLIPIFKGGDNRISNLIPLCAECHGLIHNKNFKYDKEEWKKAQKLGCERAKKEGKFKGGQIKRLDKEKYFKLKNKYLNREINKGEFAELLKVSRPTLNKILKEVSTNFVAL